MRRMETLQSFAKAGIATMLDKLHMRGFSSMNLLDLMRDEEVNLWKDDYYLYPSKHDYRYTHFSWIVTDDNFLVGAIMTIGELREVFKKNGINGWPDGL